MNGQGYKMSKGDRRRVALTIIRSNLMDSARERRAACRAGTHLHFISSITFGKISMAEIAGLISLHERERYCRRLDRICSAKVSR